MRTEIGLSLAIALGAIAGGALVPLAPGTARVAAAGPKCQDIPLRVMISNPVIDPATGSISTPAITGDGADYVNGVLQVSAAIKNCSGSHDAVLNLASSRRTFTVTFPAPLEGSVTEALPAWVPGSLAVSGLINIRNLTFSHEPFATHANARFDIASERASYGLAFKGTSFLLSNAPNLTDPSRTPAANTPFPSSFAVVYPSYPATCGAGSMPSWDVVVAGPNSPGTQVAVGTLLKAPSHGDEIHEGQYSIPFEMQIKALQCFAY